MSAETQEDLSTPVGDLPPAVTLLQMMTGYWVSQAVYVAAKLGIADHLAYAAMNCEGLAAITHSHPYTRERP